MATNSNAESLIIKIESLVERISNITDVNHIEQRDQMNLILNQLKSILQSCDEKLLLKPIIENITSHVTNIESNVINRNYTSNQTYLFELLKYIAFLSNSNNKQNLQGYHQSVNKNISSLENDAKRAFDELEQLNTKIELNNKELDAKKDDLMTKYTEAGKSYMEELKQINKDLAKNKNEFDLKLEKSQMQIDKNLESLQEKLIQFTTETKNELNALMNSAKEKMNYVAGASYSTTYMNYSNKAKSAAKWWYSGTILSMLALIIISFIWLCRMNFSNINYLSLSFKLFVTVGFAAISRYCAIQASKNKSIEVKLRRIQLLMSTFDAFISTLSKEEQNSLRIELTKNLINQKDWLEHDKDEVDIVKEFEKLFSTLGYSVELKKNKSE